MTITMDDGFSFGLGLFETIAVEGGRPVFLEEHLQRLTRGAKQLGIQREKLDEKILEAEVLKRLRQSEKKRGALKLNVTQENIVLTERANPYQDSDYERGFVLRLSPVRRNETSPLTYLKTMNYGDNIMEKRRAHREGFDEPVFLNTKGEITEGATTNLFAVKKGVLFTPPVSCGLLPGIFRQFVMKNFNVEEKVLMPQDIGEADELFVTNSLLGVMPVSRFEGRDLTERIFAQKVWKKYKSSLL